MTLSDKDHQDHDRAIHDAQMAVLTEIKRLTEFRDAVGLSAARGALQLAEAYAWLRFPNQPHGASSS